MGFENLKGKNGLSVMTSVLGVKIRIPVGHFTLIKFLLKDKNCKNYPFQDFKSYRECDDLYVQNQLKRFDLIPFWAAENYSSVTRFR